MIPEIINLWDKNKHLLKSTLETTEQKHYHDYESLLKMIIDVVLPEMEFNIDKMVVIDNGDYQGTQIFIIPKNGYQPDITDHYYTHNYYGSCSGCDWLQGISQYDDDLPNENQVKQYMGLSLHLIQRFKPFQDFEA